MPPDEFSNSSNLNPVTKTTVQYSRNSEGIPCFIIKRNLHARTSVFVFTRLRDGA